MNRTLLLHAAFSNSPRCLALLIHKGADLQATNEFGASAFHLAQGKRDQVCLKILLIAATNRNLDLSKLVSEDTGTVVHEAALHTNIADIKLILRYYPELIRAENNDGQSPWRYLYVEFREGTFQGEDQKDVNETLAYLRSLMRDDEICTDL